MNTIILLLGDCRRRLQSRNDAIRHRNIRRDGAAVQQIPGPARTRPDPAMRDRRARRRGAFAEVDVRDRTHAPCRDGPRAGCPHDVDTGVAGVGRFARRLRSRIGWITRVE